MQNKNAYEIVPDIDKYYFNCFVQQVISIIYHYYGEYWKLFIGQDLKLRFDSIKCFDNFLEACDTQYIIKNLNRFYGITFEKIDKNSKLEFESDQIYIASIDNKNYPLSNGVQDGTHCFIIYGVTQNKYQVLDNFYESTEFLLDESIYKEYVNPVYLIKHCKRNQDESIKEIIANQLCVIPEWITRQSYLNVNNIEYRYDSSKLYDILRYIASYIKRDAVIINEISNCDEYIQLCSNLTNQISQHIKLIQHNLLKSQLKHNTIPNNYLAEQINEVIKSLICCYKIKNEVAAMLKNEDNLKNRLKEQLIQYFDLHGIDTSNYNDSLSIYNIHDKFSIIYLINYYEECNEINDISYSVYSKCNTYSEFILATYEKILCNNLAI